MKVLLYPIALLYMERRPDNEAIDGLSSSNVEAIDFPYTTYIIREKGSFLHPISGLYMERRSDIEAIDELPFCTIPAIGFDYTYHQHNARNGLNHSSYPYHPF